MNRPIRSTSVYRCLGLALACAGVALASAAAAQEPRQPRHGPVEEKQARPPREAPCDEASPAANAGDDTARPVRPTDPPAEQPRDREIRVFSLRHTGPAEAAQVITSLLASPGRAPAASRITCTTDFRTNSLIVAADPKTFAQVEAILERLDVPGPDKTGKSRPTRIFRLAHAAPDKSLEAALALVLAKDGSFVLDAARQLVVVKADEPSVRLVESVLAEIDRPVAPHIPPGPAPTRVRIVWLVSGLDLDDAAGPPADLKGVVDELSKIGVGPLVLAAQTVVQTTSDGKFSLSCSPRLRNVCSLRVEGSLGEAPGPNRKLTINRLEAIEDLTQRPATPLPPGVAHTTASRQWCRLETSILAPLGRPVVLSVSPTEDATSVFVIQLLPDEPPTMPTPAPAAPRPRGRPGRGQRSDEP